LIKTGYFWQYPASGGERLSPLAGKGCKTAADKASPGLRQQVKGVQQKKPRKTALQRTRGSALTFGSDSGAPAVRDARIDAERQKTAPAGLAIERQPVRVRRPA